MAEDGIDRTRTVNEEYLRYLSRRLADQQAVEGTSLFPANKPETLVVSFHSEYYPSSIDEVRLELRAYTNGDFHVSYVETYIGERRTCRWGRHDQPHSTRDHFHPLPDAGTSTVADRDCPTDLDAVLADVVFPWIEHRLEELWTDERA